MTLSCGHEPTPSLGVGYGTDAEGKTYCYLCCAERDRLDMTMCGRTILYLTATPRFGGAEQSSNLWTVTNWPGSLSYAVHTVHTGRHNIAGRRYDVWFRDDLGATWHGVTYSGNTQLCHCRRLKGR